MGFNWFRLVLTIEKRIVEARLRCPRLSLLLLLLVNPVNLFLLFPRFILRKVLGANRMQNVAYRRVLKYYGLTYLILKFRLPRQKNLIKKRNYDMLIVLDACRYDYFKFALQRFFVGELQDSLVSFFPVLSAGTETDEWLENVFGDGAWKNFVYVSGNPFVSMSFGKYSPKIFYSIVPVWKYGFDEELNTVPPNKVLNAWLSATFKMPNKNYIIHFLQPHFPTIDKHYRIRSSEPDEIIKLVRSGVKSRAWIRKSYLANLIHVLQWVVKTIKIAKLIGIRKIIVTSDHGDLVELGGHPYGTYVTDLCIVPWVEINLEKLKLRPDERKAFEQLILLQARLARIRESLKRKSSS